jgi:hypothetical protein
MKFFLPTRTFPLLKQLKLIMNVEHALQHITSADVQNMYDILFHVLI